jgi:predicted metal-dependent phosphoesterase TrpH
MKTDLHIHTKTGSDGALTIREVFAEAKNRGITFISITDHDNIEHQGLAIELAAANDMRYVTGVELNVTFPYGNKSASLDFLAYNFDYHNPALIKKLYLIRDHREKRARQIVENLNREFEREKRPLFTNEDVRKMQQGADSILSRPHIADYLISKEVVESRQEAFDKYLVRCDVPKYPLTLDEASALVRGAGGKMVLAHPNDPNGTSLISITNDLAEQTKIISKYLLEYIDGIECWHSRNNQETTEHYIAFSKANNLIMTGGSDCHQKPIIMGTVEITRGLEQYFFTPD